ncbi:MAG TPA: FecR domain-containing protein, partial [Blastocatellia bacterium]|nr:FecR domain-containing protein [Blastocatellia bacterium]
MLFATASELLDRRRTARAALFLTILVSLFTLAVAQDQIIRIARISLVEGEVSYQRAADSNKEWFDATPNLPINERDQLYSGPSGRAEIQLSGRNLVRIDRNTNLRFTQFNTATTQFAVPVGTATFRVDSLDRRQFQIVDANDAGKDDPVYFEVDTPIVAVTFLKEGSYRINVQDDGSTEVIVRRGQAEVYNQEIGSVTVKQGRRIVIDGRDANYFQIARL